MTEVEVVLVTVPDEESARALCRTLLDERLVACGNIVHHVTSLYRWEGAVCEDPEVLILFKTARNVVSNLLERISELHPYDLPEILNVPVAAGYAPYLDWVTRETGSRESS